MAVKPIIDISVKSQEFERFLELYHGYSADVEAQPDKWNRVNEAMSGAGEWVIGKVKEMITSGSADRLLGDSNQETDVC